MSTIYRSAVEAGYSQALHDDQSAKKPHARQVGLAQLPVEGDDPLLGLGYHCDYKAEEEWGVNDLRTTFNAGADPASSLYALESVESDFSAGPAQARLLHVTDTQWVLMTQPVAAMPLTGDRTLALALAEQRAMSIPGAPYRWQVERMTIPELKQHCRSRGSRVKANSKKADWVAEYMKLNTPTDATVMPGWFQRGTHLVLPRGSGVFRFVADHLIDAARRGTLSVGNTSMPFGASLSLFDFDDVPETMLQQIRDDRAWYAEQMATLEPVSQTLHEAGHRWYFLGRPSHISTVPGTEPTIKYWLNSCSYRLPNGDWYQPYGWYSLQELREEKFITDLMEKKEIDPADRDKIQFPK